MNARLNRFIFLLVSTLFLISCQGFESSPNLDTTGISTNSTQVQLSWDAPTSRLDGSPLAAEEIAEYRIYYSKGQEAGKGVTYISLPPSVTAYMFDSLSPGEYYFAATCVDTENRESPLSVQVTRIVQ